MQYACLIGSIIMYSGICISNIRDKDYCHAFIWFSYVLSQFGFLAYEINKK